MAKRKGSPAPSSSRARKKVDRDAREAVDAQILLDKLPPEVWEKILDELDENDLFPLALSCKYFRQKQKELVARTRQSGKPCLALQTALRWQKGKPVSADYLRFCSKEKVSWEVRDKKARCIRRLAAFYGHLPLLQELLGPSWTNNNRQQHIAWAAGKSPFHSLFFFVFFLTFFSFSILHSARRPTGDLAVAESPRRDQAEYCSLFRGLQRRPFGDIEVAQERGLHLG